MSVAELTTKKPPLKPEEKRALVRSKFAELASSADTLTDEEIESAHKALMEFELRRLLKVMSDGAEDDERAGLLEPVEVEAAIKEFRARHPYR
ncbi:MAG TPA: hypothetical protein DDZ88_21475 [Verrucomicrobiales bacterium]|nr:hypothetical protein [Verrucomicrobiales bacterium]